MRAGSVPIKEFGLTLMQFINKKTLSIINYIPDIVLDTITAPSEQNQRFSKALFSLAFTFFTLWDKLYIYQSFIAFSKPM